MPVGHGFFHFARIEEEDSDWHCNYVYDCGGASKKIINQRIDELAEFFSIRSYPKNIDMLVISHFHSDHIKGVKYFLDKFSVKKLVIPYLTDEEKIEAVVEMVSDDTDTAAEYSKFVTNTEEWLSERGFDQIDLTIVRGGEIDPTNRSDAGFDNDLDQGEINLKKGLISHNEIAKINTNFYGLWIFKFYQKLNGNQKTTIHDELIEKFSFKDKDELLKNISNSKWINNNYDELSLVYKKIGSNKQNSTSLCMFSGLSENIRREINTRISFCYKNFKFPPPYYLNREYNALYIRSIGWLATGDAELKNNIEFNNFSAHFKDHLDIVDTITIPHHGSIENYNGGISKIGKFSVITSNQESDDKGLHPNLTVMMDLNLNHRKTFIVDKLNINQLTQEFYIYI